jgi:NAD(P)-dependent dehydrogenase (short-subunit alcohol dehydrogenase family)
MIKPAVLITGALGGIGRALCNEFHAHGFIVIAVDRAAGAVTSHHLIRADIRNLISDTKGGSSFRNSVLESAKKEGAQLIGIINNAAIQILGGVDSLKVDDWKASFDINVIAPFYLTQLFLTDLEAVYGSIVNISSIHEKLTKPGFVAYATTKSALSGLTRAMAVDLGSRVRVNAICPAAIQTAMLDAGFSAHPERLAALHEAHPSGRIGTPEEVATLARYLVSDAPEFLTGTCLGLDGAIASRLHDPN